MKSKLVAGYRTSPHVGLVVMVAETKAVHYTADGDIRRDCFSRHDNHENVYAERMKF